MTAQIARTYGKKLCDWCSIEFISTRANQIYCTNECCKYATNKKILERYHANKDKKRNKPEYCECGSKLSKYNHSDECHSCQLKKEDSKRIDLLKTLGFSYESDE